ncbi:MAG: hypothetical protein ACLTCP_10465 [Ruminococcus bicirculans (ex Wegman et al. 2014)]
MNITHTACHSRLYNRYVCHIKASWQQADITAHAFDYINGITIGSIASEMAVSQEMDELIVPVIAMVLYGPQAFCVCAYDKVYPL